MEIAVKKAVENESFTVHNVLKEHYENEDTRAVEEAQEEALRVIQEATRNARQEHNRQMVKLNVELQQQFHHEKGKALDKLRGELQQ